VATDFLANYLPPDVAAELDLTALELVKDSFVDVELQQHFSDLLYQVRLKRGGEAYAYVLFEHKSAPEAWVAFQVLRYLVRIWEQALEQKVKKLPPIFPLVLYHGRARWRAAHNFGALIEWKEAAALRKYAPEFEYYLVDLSAYSEAEIKGEGFLRAGLLLMKYISSKGLALRLPGILALLPLWQESALEYLRTILIYLAKGTRKIKESEFAEALKKAFPQKGEKAMQFTIDSWIQEGEQKGRQEGRQEGTAALTLRQLRRRVGTVDAETEARIRALSFEQLEQLGEALLDFSTPDDLAVWLREHDKN
jgi:predicted transposase/invertase (TIGR01784 family)